MAYVSLQEECFEGDLLLVPCVSVGAVPQLAVDVIATAGLSAATARRVGFFRSDWVLPVAASDPFQDDETENSYSVDVYRDAQKHITIVQLRAPIVKNANGPFARMLLEWASSNKMTRMILLQSIDSGLRRDAQLSGPQVRALVLPVAPESAREGVLASPDAATPPTPSPSPWGATLESSGVPPLEKELALDAFRCGSFPSQLLHANASGARLDVLALVAFAAHGAAFADGVALARCANAFLPQPFEVTALEASVPSSWRHMVDRLPLPAELY